MKYTAIVQRQPEEFEIEAETLGTVYSLHGKHLKNK